MSESLPLISICIPAYNTADFIAETIQCWFNQDYQNIEIIIQDDCSTDDTYNIASKIAKNDPRLKVYRNTRNLGIGKNWNEAYKKINGEYVVIFNADDLIPNSFIHHLLPILQNNENIDFVSCAFKYWILDKDGNYFIKDTYHQMPIGYIHSINELLFKSYPFSHVFTLHKRSSLDTLKMLNGDLFIEHQVCDYELWIRMGLANFTGYQFNQIHGLYRKHYHNNSYIHNAEFSGTKEVLKHHTELKHQNKRLYKKWLYLNIYHHLKNCIRYFRTPHWNSVFLLIKYYFK